MYRHLSLIFVLDNCFQNGYLPTNVTLWDFDIYFNAHSFLTIRLLVEINSKSDEKFTSEEPKKPKKLAYPLVG